MSKLKIILIITIVATFFLTIFAYESYAEEQRETIVKLEAMIMELRRENNELIGITEQLNIPATDVVELTARVIEQEAGNQGLEGKLAVANVLLNRVENPKFPNDLKSVITSRGQFESYESGRYARVNVSKETYQALEKALAGEQITEAVYFCNYGNIGPKAKKWFNSLEEVNRIGNHRFYK